MWKIVEHAWLGNGGCRLTARQLQDACGDFAFKKSTGYKSRPHLTVISILRVSSSGLCLQQVAKGGRVSGIGLKCDHGVKIAKGSMGD